MDRGYYKLYPNIYVLIVAESARVRKSIAMDTGIDLLREALPDIYYISGSLTPEGLVNHLNRAKTVVDIEGRPIVRYDSAVVIHADELAELFGYDKQRASKLTILLTKTYGAQGEHTHTLADGQIKLHNLYPSLLAATDPRNLKVLPEDAIGGLIGRLIFVTAREKRRSIAWPEPSDEDRKLYKYLCEDLQEVGSLQGEMIPTQKARDLFARWYDALSEQKSTDVHTDAFRERCHDTALKLAMLIAVSRSNELVVDHTHVAGGIAFIEKQLPEFGRVMTWAVTSTFAQNKAKLVDMIRRNGGALSRRVALKALAVSTDDLAALETTLIQEDTMESRVIGNQVIYKLTRDALLNEQE